ncbi:hypothetical protein E2562_013765 [Oryza meyeriana var. granulata]|uniref:Uncharacterized protein n=1 Tax=Oryza meyeriana var. granulata TaxID=110450 RepID=A0A6G1F7V5_9ORYZ|nr:hypothetical protein E2562_013765 [Oryza meyeriana var. granulata]
MGEDATVTNAKEQGLEQIGSSEPRKVGPMDKFAMALDPRIPFNAINNEEFDRVLEAAGRFGPGWLIDGGEEELDGEPVRGLTWKLIEEACGADEVTKLRRSSRLAQARDIDEEDFHSETEDTPTNEEEIEFESDQEDVTLDQGSSFV